MSGPGTVTFTNPSALATNAAFTQSGAYVIRLTANDGLAARSDDLLVSVYGTNPGDVNGDGVVKVDDLNAVTSNFGKTYP